MVESRVQVVLGAVLGCAAVAAAAGSAAVVQVPAGKLVASGDDGLYVLNTDGTGLRRIAREEDYYSFPYESPAAWSPDGSRIAFANGAYLMIVHPDGSGLRTLGNDAADLPDLPPRWSPDGSRLAYDGCGGFCVRDLATEARKSFVSDDKAGGVDWSPDGKSIVFGGKRTLNIVDVETGARRTIALAKAAGPAGDPAWSHDGSTIAFFGGAEFHVRLYVVAAAGGTPRVLATASSNDNSRAAWAPNAPLIAYARDNSVHVVSAVTGRDVQLSASRFNAGSPSWTAGGEGVVFAQNRMPGDSILTSTDLWYVALDGGARRITDPFPTGAEYAEPAFAAGSVAAVPVAPAQPQLELPRLASLMTKNQIAAVTAAGRGAAAATFPYPFLCGDNLAWNPPSRRVGALPGDCEDAQGIDRLAAAPGLVAWTYDEDTNDAHYSALQAGRPGGALLKLAGGENDAPQPANLRGDGTLVVFQTLRGEQYPTTLWRVVADPKPRIERLGERPFSDAVAAVDGGRILLRDSARKLTLLDARAKPLRSLSVRTGPRDSIFLTGNMLVVAQSGRISALDARSGRLRHRWRLVGDAPQVESVRGDLAAYVSGIALHLLRLDTGVDRIVALPGVGAPPSAAFSPRGLFVGYSAIDSPRRPGRLLLLRIR